ncbi:unnamed protein product [Macrosiphum euphorbiae]|uniref:Uncharacterized protein n=1 Tax=Macrosiphum euphorbiae TaxID=13131 RepID=A0AAV0WXM0_9HEMI|nr:unnamed protein product [Macrosiphum euphorbiae]
MVVYASRRKIVPLSVLATLPVGRRLILRIPLPTRRGIDLAGYFACCAGAPVCLQPVAPSLLSSDVAAFDVRGDLVGIDRCSDVRPLYCAGLPLNYASYYTRLVCYNRQSPSNGAHRVLLCHVRRTYVLTLLWRTRYIRSRNSAAADLIEC